MAQQFLYEQLDGAKKMGLLPIGDIPAFITDNLNPSFVLRDYQKEAFARFFHCYTKPFEGKEVPLHLLFNMATGSGKTLIMAGLILYLYEQGYRNFLFFVNSNNIITKTKENFLESSSFKYLFAQGVFINNKRIQIRQVDNFEDSNPEGINICFTTIQKLHSDLTNEKEGMPTFDDFKSKRTVLLSDEAHHTQKVTKQSTLGDGFESSSWENTVEKVLRQNDENILLEFTATMDFLHAGIKAKYLNKVLFRYDLKQFRNDGFSKDPEIFATDTDRRTRMLQAIIVSQYRQEVASAHSIALKPVILFKAQGTIAQSHENKKLFHELIDSLTVKELQEVRKNGTELMNRAFRYFETRKVTDAILVRKLKDGFAENRCLTVNEESLDKKSLDRKERLDVLAQQKTLNSLEDKNNQIRAIFAVQKLNEGWDVLNLFDIVRMYETRDSKDNKPGKTTISEAQLIGRGARYYPFSLSNGEDKYIRKYDKNLDDDLRMLEELHYHCHPGDKSRYITDIKIALVQFGLMDTDVEEVDMKLKEDFKKTSFYKSGVVYGNDRVRYSFSDEHTIRDLAVAKKNHVFKVLSGQGTEESLFANKPTTKTGDKIEPKDIGISEIETHVVRSALARKEFFSFDNLKLFFPSLGSSREFATKTEYLGGLKITFQGTKYDIENLSNSTKHEAVLSLLDAMEAELKKTATEYRGTTELKSSAFRLVFSDKRLKVKVAKKGELIDDHKDQLAEQDWYVFDSNYGTSEERALIELVGRQVSVLKKDFKEIYLVRNEQQFKLYNFEDGRGFEPDFLLFLVNKKGEHLTYQLFIEPKGQHLMDYDAWKDAFLERISTDYKEEVFELSSGGKYRVVGLPFYNQENENDFITKLTEAITDSQEGATAAGSKHEYSSTPTKV